MNIVIAPGKGGVGKTTVSCEIALALAERGKTVAIDFDGDGAHSIGMTLGMVQGWDEELPGNQLLDVPQIPNLTVYVIENRPFRSLDSFKDLGLKGQEAFNPWFAQFPGMHGTVAVEAMSHEFYGLGGGILQRQRLVFLHEILQELKRQRYQNVVIDVEGTAGLAEMLEGADRFKRSLYNLNNKGRVELTVLALTAKDIGYLLKSDFFTIDLEELMDDYDETIALLKEAHPVIVTNPMASPAKQTQAVRARLNSFGVEPVGYVINRVTGADHEQRSIDFIISQGLPVMIHAQDNRLQTEDPIPIMREVGGRILQAFSL